MNESDPSFLCLTRVFDAPRATVFNAWIEPDTIKRWWGPRGYTTLSCDIDPRPGGAWRIRSRSPEGTEYVEVGTFREIAAPERIVFTHAWEDQQGRRGHETLVTVTFVEHDGKTTMAFQQAGFASVTSRDGHAEGWSSAFELLTEYLATM
jgi:uncharacterized protein YndB with AHSA1/START domain